MIESRTSAGSSTSANAPLPAAGISGSANARACRTDLLEGEGDELPLAGDAIEIAYRPWELITIALRV